MHIPRQASPVDEAAPFVRASHDELLTRVRTVAYWQRLVRARTDLVVAGLLYGSPVPLSTPRPNALAAPVPEDVDLRALLAGVGAIDRADGGAGQHLERLRAAAAHLAQLHQQALNELHLFEVATAPQPVNVP